MLFVFMAGASYFGGAEQMISARRTAMAAN